MILPWTSLWVPSWPLSVVCTPSRGHQRKLVGTTKVNEVTTKVNEVTTKVKKVTTKVKKVTTKVRKVTTKVWKVTTKVR